MSTHAPALTQTQLQAASIAVRTPRAEIREALRSGRMTAADVITAKPECMLGVLVVDLIRWQRWVGLGRLRDLNRAAVRDRINLCVTVQYAGPWHADLLRRELGTRVVS